MVSYRCVEPVVFVIADLVELFCVVSFIAEDECAESRALLTQIKQAMFLLTQAFSNQHLRANVKLFNHLQQLTKNCREAYCEYESITERSEERVERLLEALTDAHTYLLMYHAPQEQTT